MRKQPLFTILNFIIIIIMHFNVPLQQSPMFFLWNLNSVEYNSLHIFQLYQNATSLIRFSDESSGKYCMWNFNVFLIFLVIYHLTYTFIKKGISCFSEYIMACRLTCKWTFIFKSYTLFFACCVESYKTSMFHSNRIVKGTVVSWQPVMNWLFLNF